MITRTAVISLDHVAHYTVIAVMVTDAETISSSDVRDLSISKH